MERLVPRRCMDSPPEKFSCTTQPSIMRLILFVPRATSPGLLPGQVRSQSPTQNSSCFCSAAVHGLGGLLGVDCCARTVETASGRRRSTLHGLDMIFPLTDRRG